MNKTSVNYLISALFITLVIVFISFHTTSCSSNNEPEIIDSKIEVTKITKFKDLDSTLIEFMFIPESRVIDWPSADISPDVEIMAYDFNDPQTGISAQISKSMFDNTLLYCTFNTASSENAKKFKVRDHQNNYYTIYNENNVALITVMHNKLDNSIILTAILSAEETNQLLCGITTSAVGYALGTAAALTGPVGWSFTIAWATISFVICK